MKEQRDLEAELEELLKLIATSLPDETREAIQAGAHTPVELEFVVLRNEEGSAHADQG